MAKMASVQRECAQVNGDKLTCASHKCDLHVSMLTCAGDKLTCAHKSTHKSTQVNPRGHKSIWQVKNFHGEAIIGDVGGDTLPVIVVGSPLEAATTILPAVLPTITFSKIDHSDKLQATGTGESGQAVADDGTKAPMAILEPPAEIVEKKAQTFLDSAERMLSESLGLNPAAEDGFLGLGLDPAAEDDFLAELDDLDRQEDTPGDSEDSETLRRFIQNSIMAASFSSETSPRFPPLPPAIWAKILQTGILRDPLETCGDAAMQVVMTIIIISFLETMENDDRKSIRKQLLKYPGNALEVFAGAVAVYQSLDDLKRWVEEEFQPIILAAINARITYAKSKTNLDAAAAEKLKRVRPFPPEPTDSGTEDAVTESLSVIDDDDQVEYGRITEPRQPRIIVELFLEVQNKDVTQHSPKVATSSTPSSVTQPGAQVFPSGKFSFKVPGSPRLDRGDVRSDCERVELLK
ncbi:hypothetical protein B0H11DRAFT_1906534 [Mycena galericulata]|nr:hypothetical protein B0H11DRAFT_1906534 [Mycena galericulata]